MNNFRKILFGALVSLLLSGSCLLLVFHYTRTENVFADVLAVSFRTLALSLVLVVASWLVDAWRLRVLASAMGRKIRFWDAFKITVMGSFMAGVTPFDTGGEPLKVYYLHREGLSIGESTAVVALSAFLHATSRLLLWVFVPVLMLLTGLKWQLNPVVGRTLSVGVIVYLFFLGLLVTVTIWPEFAEIVATFICRQRVFRRLIPQTAVDKVLEKVRISARDFRDGVRRVKARGAYAFLASVLSLAYWLLVVSVPVFLLRGLGSDLPYLQVFSVTMTVYLVMAYVPTPGASGGAEAGSALFFSSLLPARVLGVFVFLWRVVTYYVTLAVGGSVVALETISWSLGKIRSEKS
ncbi:MAG: flippase-like domain-containing protein [Candidatus Fermentithermobacillus carboniphilus]|uniref:Phosphatidylglycerol lysyltransferase n=1 Tax=Candidatus Fermentithermobacillus carboniphilus TaxID=3085328 RepID=A0AAT9LC92_9FIRM|nr:MAG: flippase-like domain-containing protein [Candidatus Fermentithermobacillus carboniphilus]